MSIIKPARVIRTTINDSEPWPAERRFHPDWPHILVANVGTSRAVVEADGGGLSVLEGDGEAYLLIDRHALLTFFGNSRCLVVFAGRTYWEAEEALCRYVNGHRKGGEQ